MAKYFIDRKLKTSGFLIFEIKRDKIGQNFLKDRFSVTSDPMDMIFGVFSETSGRLLKNIITQFFSKYSKSYIIVNIKSAVEAVKLHASNRTLQDLFRMALIKSVVFVAFEILSNLVSKQNVLNANNC